MKCRYTFKVTGMMRIRHIAPIKTRGILYELITNNHGIIEEIRATTNVPPNAPTPSITPSNEQGVSANIVIHDMCFPFIEMELRTIESLLALYGVEEIDYSSSYTEWIADSEEDQQKIKISNFSVQKAEHNPETIPYTSFDSVARIIIAANIAQDDEISLGFFRKGRNDYYEGRYIEAIYDFYFMFEHLYANGKFRSKAVVSEYSNNAEFVSHISAMLTNPPKEVIGDIHARDAYMKYYHDKPVINALSRFVRVRGELHHSSSKNNSTWHPDKHHPYKMDAAVMRDVAYKIATKKTLDYIFNPRVVDEYNAMIKKTLEEIQ